MTTPLSNVASGFMPHPAKQDKKTLGISRKKKALFTLIILVFLFGFTLGVDRGLGLLGLPDEHYYIVAPPYYKRTFNNLEYRYTVEANDQGIRYRTVPLVKPEGTYRVVLLGDSFLPAIEVGMDETGACAAPTMTCTPREMGCGGQVKSKLIRYGRGRGPTPRKDSSL